MEIISQIDPIQTVTGNRDDERPVLGGVHSKPNIIGFAGLGVVPLVGESNFHPCHM